MDVKLGLSTGPERTVIAATFSEDEWELLRKFSSYAHELRDCKSFNKDLSVKLQISAGVNHPLSVNVELPDWDDVILLLHRMRPMILEKEPTTFNRIKNILSRNLSEPRLRNVLSYQDGLFSGTHALSMMRISISGPQGENEIVLNSNRFLETWLNAYEFHRDDEKRAFLEGINRLFPVEATRALLVSLVMDKIKAVCNLQGLIDLLRGDIKEFVVS